MSGKQNVHGTKYAVERAVQRGVREILPKEKRKDDPKSTEVIFISPPSTSLKCCKYVKSSHFNEGFIPCSEKHVKAKYSANTVNNLAQI